MEMFFSIDFFETSKVNITFKASHVKMQCARRAEPSFKL